MKETASALEAYFSHCRHKIDSALTENLEQHTLPNSRLTGAMQYVTLLGGKRIRPILVLATANSMGTSETVAMAPACAIEFIHAYSLVHDDLPAMDDDDLRRGKPTCHIAFDEATAILTGDALHTLAFTTLSQAPNIKDSRKINMLQTLANASGAMGMVLGQAIDLESVGKALQIEQLEQMHRHKTGALIEASVVMGAMCSDATGEQELEALRQYARAIGLAFQVQDDILDVVGDTHTLGKTQGADAALNKPTYPTLLGLKGAQEKAEQLHYKALTALNSLADFDTSTLKSISEYIIQRSN